ncbi:MAG: hypothetical protein L3K10_03650 [Thermoplasmata archaeon]|nr:hypothetical protein [Thermoplasmata archaeon]
MIFGVVVILAAFVLLWVSAPQWDGPLRPAGPRPTAQSYVYLNDTSWQFTGATGCWSPIISIGGTIPIGGIYEAAVDLPYPGGASGPACTAQSVHVNSAGFALVDSTLPQTVGPGHATWIYVNVTVPGAQYTGALTLLITVSSP